MIINGKERGFAFTIEASDEVAKLCPDNDFNKMGELFEKMNFNEIIQTDIKIAMIMNKAYEDKRAYFEEGYKPEYLTEHDFKYIEIAEVKQLEDVLLSVMKGDTKPTIQTKDKPTKK